MLDFYNLNINDIIYIQLLRLFNHPIYEQDTYNHNNTIIFNSDYIIYNNKEIGFNRLFINSSIPIINKQEIIIYIDKLKKWLFLNYIIQIKKDDKIKNICFLIK